MAIDLNSIKKQKNANREQNSGLRFNLDFLSKEITLRKKKLSDTKKERFYNQMGVLFSSGIDLGSSLQIIIDDETTESHKKKFQQIFDDVIGGMGFSEALHKTGQFTDYEYFSIKVGEESGRLQEVLKELTSYFELRVQQRRQLTGALSYPIMVMIVAVGAVIFMLNVVVPMFAGVFKRFGGELPVITRRVLNLSNWLSGNIYMCLLIIAGIILLALWFRRYDWYKKYSSLLLLRIPYIGKLTSRLMHARFCHSTALLTLAQVPLLDALEMVKKMIAFYPMQEAIEQVRQYIVKGKPMYEGMAKQKVFDRRLVSLTKVGEEVNQIGPIYSKLYTQYTAEVKHMTSILGNMLEPVMIIFVGVLVMIILIAMYMPLFQLSTTVV
jgi:type IV pilus assembly protein PilC